MNFVRISSEELPQRSKIISSELNPGPNSHVVPISSTLCAGPSTIGQPLKKEEVGRFSSAVDQLGFYPFSSEFCPGSVGANAVAGKEKEADMSDDVAKLKAELDALNLQCQLARDHEIRYALQRSRLEVERTKLLVKLMDAHRGPPEATHETAPPSTPYAIRYSPTPLDAAGLNGAAAVVASFTDVKAVVARRGRSGTAPGKAARPADSACHGAGRPRRRRRIRPWPRPDAARGRRLIKKRWWPDAEQRALRGFSGWVCRMAKEGRLAKDSGGRYTVAKSMAHASS